MGIQRAREHAHGIVAAIAVAGKLHALGAQENIDALAVKRRAEGVGMEGLAPLVVRLFVAVAAVASIRKCAGGEKLIPLHRGIAGEGDIVFGECEVVGFPDGCVVGFAGGRLLCPRIFAGMRDAKAKHASKDVEQGEGTDGPGLALQHACIPWQQQPTRRAALIAADIMLRAGNVLKGAGELPLRSIVPGKRSV